MKKIIIFLIIVVSLFCLSGAWYVQHMIKLPNNPRGEEKSLTIPSGQGFKTIAARLYRQGLVRNETVFYLLGRITGQSTEIKAGHYRVHESWNMTELLEHLTTGSEALNRLQIPEGLNWWQTGRLLEEHGLVEFEKFRQLVHDRDFLEKHGISAPTAEGFLFPETYHLSPTRDVGAERILSILFSQFWESTEQLWKDMGFEDIYQTVNMASLIEKETALPEERRLISGVFHNRLDRNMLLQCDPTIIYGLGLEFDGNLRRVHLEDRENEYNTYRHRGFPPTPICSPGLASLEAALNPEDHDYLYFVSRNDGSHHFSKNLSQHNRAVRKFQK